MKRTAAIRLLVLVPAFWFRENALLAQQQQTNIGLNISGDVLFTPAGVAGKQDFTNFGAVFEKKNPF